MRCPPFQTTLCWKYTTYKHSEKVCNAHPYPAHYTNADTHHLGKMYHEAKPAFVHILLLLLLPYQNLTPYTSKLFTTIIFWLRFCRFDQIFLLGADLSLILSEKRREMFYIEGFEGFHKMWCRAVWFPRPVSLLIPEALFQQIYSSKWLGWVVQRASV